MLQEFFVFVINISAGGIRLPSLPMVCWEVSLFSGENRLVRSLWWLSLAWFFIQLLHLMIKLGFSQPFITLRYSPIRSSSGSLLMVSFLSTPPGSLRKISILLPAVMSTGGWHGGRSFAHYASKSFLFSNFILDNSLFDLGLSGTKFTWYNDQNDIYKIDFWPIPSGCQIIKWFPISI